MDNPFVYGKEVRGYQFYDRREACDGYSVGDPIFTHYLRTLSAAKVF